MSVLLPMISTGIIQREEEVDGTNRRITAREVRDIVYAYLIGTLDPAHVRVSTGRHGKVYCYDNTGQQCVTREQRIFAVDYVSFAFRHELVKTFYRTVEFGSWRSSKIGINHGKTALC